MKSCGQAATIFVSLLVLGVGFWVYTTAASPYGQCQSTLGGLAQAFNQSIVTQCSDISTRYYVSIGIMGLGPILFLLGLFGLRGNKD